MNLQQSLHCLKYNSRAFCWETMWGVEIALWTKSLRSVCFFRDYKVRRTDCVLRYKQCVV